MKNIFSILLLSVFLFSCGTAKKLNVATISSIYIEYNAEQNLNFGNEFEGEIIARLIDGNEVKVTHNKKVKFSTTDFVRGSKKNRFIISKSPHSFSDDSLFVTFTYTNKDEVFTSSQSIKLNFKGPLFIDKKGGNGTNGRKGKDRNTPLVYRDGNNGENGTNGTNGSSASDYNVYIWKENDFVFVYVKDIHTGLITTYKCLENAKITLDVSGGNGGNGGKGGDGGKGKDGKITKENKKKRPGNGGNGGNGGDGGNGGNGGSVFVYIHPSAINVQENLTILNYSGLGGKFGAFGSAGLAGQPLPGQSQALNGKNGMNGRKGIDGKSGERPQINVIEFDFSVYK